MVKYPKIFIDETQNTPNDVSIDFNAEVNYDFLHHTHKMSDIVDDIGSGGGTGEGTVGLNGKSAYEVWLSLGSTGSEQDFINSLKGADGKDGANGLNGKDGLDGKNGSDGSDGKSVYEVWLSLGNTGTEQDFINSLKADSVTYDDTALIKRIADLESRPQIYVSPTQPTNLKDGDFWIEG